jgi:hypothetical protein
VVYLIHAYPSGDLHIVKSVGSELFVPGPAEVRLVHLPHNNLLFKLRTQADRERVIRGGLIHSRREEPVP